MVATRLYDRGASCGQTMAFLLASPWNSLSLTLILIGLIGLSWTLMFIVLSMLIALATGWMFNRLVATGTLPANRNRIELPGHFRFWHEARVQLKSTSFDRQFFKEAVVSGVQGSRLVVRWLLFGILLAALLRVILNPAQFEQYFGPSLIGLLVTIGMATVLEVLSLIHI